MNQISKSQKNVPQTLNFTQLFCKIADNKYGMKKLSIFISIVMICVFPLNAHARSESYWKLGMGIGAGVGAVVVGVPLGIVGAYSGTSHGDGEDHDLGGFTGTKAGLTFGLVGAAGGALIGMGIGAAIGAAIHKKDQQVTVSPIIDPTGKSPMYGMSLTIRR